MRARNLTVAVAVMAFLLALVPSAGWAQDEKNWSVTLAVDYYSIYLFRGLDLLADEPVTNPYVYATFGSLGVYYYGYFGDVGDPGPRYQESDFGLDYTWTLGSMSWTLGGVTYTYQDPADYEDTVELYSIMAWDGWWATPKLSVWYDIDLVDGAYAQFALSHSFPAGEKASFDVSAGLGYDLGYYSNFFGTSDSSGLNDFLVTVNVPIAITDTFGIHLMGQHSVSLDILDDPLIAQEDETLFAVGASFYF